MDRPEPEDSYNTTNTVFITEITEEGNRFGVSKGSGGTFLRLHCKNCVVRTVAAQ